MAGTLITTAEELLGGSVLEPTSGYRTAIGALGAALPPLLVAWPKAEGVQTSISAYYYTGMRDWFVGTLWVIGVFLFFYRYRPRRPGEARSPLRSVRTGLADAYLGKIAGVSAVCVALLPTAPVLGSSIAPPRIGFAHGLAAGVLFATLSLFPLFLFSQSRERSGMYRACGVLMLLLLALIAAYARAPQAVREYFAPSRPVLVLEWLLIWAFAFSWFAKGLEPRTGAVGPGGGQEPLAPAAGSGDRPA